MNSTKFFKSKKILKLIVCISLLFYILLAVDYQDLAYNFKSAKSNYIILLYSAVIPLTLMSAYKWLLLLEIQGIRNEKFTHLWGLYYVGIFFNNFLPTEVGGDVLRSYEVAKDTGKYLESLVAVTAERVTGFYALVIYGFAGMFLNWKLAHYYNINYIL